MLSSGDVSQMMASQQAMFGSQRSYADNIGVQPQWNNVGSMGGPRGGGSGFNYGPNSITSATYGGGNRFAGHAMGVAAAAGVIAPLAAGLATQFVPKLGFAAPLFDPFSAFGAARGIGLGFGASLGAAALPIAAGMAVGAGVNAFVGGGREQLAINQQMGQYQHFNSSSRTGQGFTRDDSKMIGDQIRELSHLPEMMTSVGELTKVMGKLKGTGAMTGVKDIQEFSRRFKESLDTIKSLSKVMGTTLEDAEGFFAHSRGVGMFGRTDQVKNALNVQFTSGVTGMTQGQVMGLQQQGAALATSVGGQRGQGARGITNLAQGIGLSLQSGNMREGLIEDMTGMGAEEGGIGAAAGMIHQGMVGLASGTSFGRAILAGATKFDKSGKALGLDEDIVRRLNSGSMSIDQVKSRGMNLTDKQKISFTGRQGLLSSSFAEKLDPSALAGLLGNMTGNDDEKTKLLLQRLVPGMNENAADLFMELTPSLGNAGKGQMSKRAGQEAAIRERSPDAIWKAVKTKLHSASGLGAVEQAGADFSTKMSKAYDGFIDDLVGRHVATLSKGGAKALEKALSGGGMKDLNRLFAKSTFGKEEMGDSEILTGRSSAAGVLGGIGGALVGGIGGALVGGGVASLLTGSAGAVAGYEAGARWGNGLVNSAVGMDTAARGRRGSEMMGVAAGVSYAPALKALVGTDRKDLKSMGITDLTRSRAENLSRSIVASIPGWEGMTAQDKEAAYTRKYNEKLEEAPDSDMVRGSREATSLLGMSKVGKGVSESTLSMIAGGIVGSTYKDQIDLEQGFGGIDLKSLSSVSGIAALRESTRTALGKTGRLGEKGMSEGALSLLETSDEATSLITGESRSGDKVLGLTREESRDVFGRIGATDEEKAKILNEKRGTHFQAKEMASLEEALNVAKGQDIKGLVSRFNLAKDASDRNVIVESLKGTEKEFGKAGEARGLDEATRAGFKALSEGAAMMYGGDEGEGGDKGREGGRDKFVSSLVSVSEHIGSLKGEARERALAAVPESQRGVIEGEIQIHDRLSGLKGASLTGKDLAKKLGLSFEGEKGISGLLSKEAGGFAIDDTKVKLTPGMIASLTKSLGGKFAGGEIAPEGSITTATKDDRLIATLTTIDKNQSQMLTALQTLTGGTIPADGESTPAQNQSRGKDKPDPNVKK